MHTYRKAKDGVWEVGFYEPRCDSEGKLFYEWRSLQYYGAEREAQAWVSYLNGGARPQ